MCDDCLREGEETGCSVGVTMHGGYRVCGGCGVEMESVLDSGPEWRRESDTPWGSGRNRVGGTFMRSLPETSMRTYLSKARGGKDTGIARLLIRQHQWTAGARPYHERARTAVFRTIEAACSRLGISRDTRALAETLFTDTNSLARTRAEGRTGLIAACVLVAARRTRVPRSPKELAAVFCTSPVCITKGVKLIHTTLHCGDGEGVVSATASASVPNSSPSSSTGSCAAVTTTPSPSSPGVVVSSNNNNNKLYVGSAGDFVPRFCSVLGLDPRAAAVATNVARAARETGIVRDNTPPSVAGGVVLFVSELVVLPASVSKSRRARIAEVSGVSVVTIVKVRKQLYAYRSHLLGKSDVAMLVKVRGA